MAATRFFLALLLLTTATAHADEGHAFDITTATSVPRKVLNGGSEGRLASVASQTVSALQGALEVVESVLNLNAPVPGASNGVEKLSGMANFKKVINSGKKVVVSFTAAKKCRPCKMMAPVFEQMSDWPSLRTLAFYTVDVNTDEDIAHEELIKAMPTFMMYKDGQYVGKVVGADPNKLRDALDNFAEA